MECCYHLHMGNAVKLFLTFCNTGLDHETHYISNIKCCNCGEDCEFIVRRWEYVDGYLDLKLQISNRLFIKNKKLDRLVYRHYPTWLIDIIGDTPMKVSDLCDVIRKIMPNRLTQWVLNSYLKGNMYTPGMTIDNPKEFIELFWRSLCGYTRKIIQKEKRMVWV